MASLSCGVDYFRLAIGSMIFMLNVSGAIVCQRLCRLVGGIDGVLGCSGLSTLLWPDEGRSYEWAMMHL